MTLSGILFGRDLFAAISGTSYVIAVVMPLIGYGSGYLLATGFRLPDASRRTVGKHKLLFFVYLGMVWFIHAFL